MDPVFKGTLQFNLYMANGCLADEITIQTDIDDLIYYINEDTHEPDFIQGTVCSNGPGLTLKFQRQAEPPFQLVGRVWRVFVLLRSASEIKQVNEGLEVGQG